MKVCYITMTDKLAFGDPNRPYREWTTVDFCCEKMKEAWNAKLIGFSDWYEYPQTDTNVNLYHHYWGIDNYTIGFCPFCGKKIEVIEKEIVAKSKA